MSDSAGRRKVPVQRAGLVVPAYIAPRASHKKQDDRTFRVGDKIRVKLYRGKIEEAIVRAVVQQIDGIKTTGGCCRSRPHGVD